MNLFHNLVWVFAFLLINPSDSTLNTETQLINDTSSLIIEENVPFINNETLYIQQLFYNSVDYLKLRTIYITQVNLLGYLKNSFTEFRDASLIYYQDQFKQALQSPQASTDIKVVQNAANILHEQWNLISFFFNNSLTILESQRNMISLNYNSQVTNLSQAFFSQYFDSNFTIYVI